MFCGRQYRCREFTRHLVMTRCPGGWVRAFVVYHRRNFLRLGLVQLDPTNHQCGAALLCCNCSLVWFSGGKVEEYPNVASISTLTIFLLKGRPTNSTDGMDGIHVWAASTSVPLCIRVRLSLCISSCWRRSSTIQHQIPFWDFFLRHKLCTCCTSLFVFSLEGPLTHPTDRYGVMRGLLPPLHTPLHTST